MMNKSGKEILNERREIERELSSLLKKTKSDFTLEDIKEAIYEEEDMEDFQDIIAMFDTGEAFEELENILDVVNDAWNFFPHRSLGGLSPEEKIIEN